jgi:MFS family permease
MNPRPFATLSGRAAILGFVVLTLAVGFCLFDGDETGTPGHLSAPDLCNGLALFAVAVTLLGLGATGEVSLGPAAATYRASRRRLEPPPKFRSLS